MSFVDTKAPPIPLAAKRSVANSPKKCAPRTTTPVPPVDGPLTGSSPKTSSAAPYTKEASRPPWTCALPRPVSWCVSYNVTPGAPDPSALAEKSLPLIETPTGAVALNVAASGALAGDTHSTRLTSTYAAAVTVTEPNAHFRELPVSRNPVPVKTQETPPRSVPKFGRARNTFGRVRASTDTPSADQDGSVGETESKPGAEAASIETLESAAWSPNTSTLRSALDTTCTALSPTPLTTAPNRTRVALEPTAPDARSPRAKSIPDTSNNDPPPVEDLVDEATLFGATEKIRAGETVSNWTPCAFVTVHAFVSPTFDETSRETTWNPF
mmetsp:Transcript_5912/g.19634  ORF Transcript_5912/g.19634 Transcript_5912/m.19634 type:complete len:326 (+) Transcript_5912:1120-2097(+)